MCRDLNSAAVVKAAALKAVHDGSSYTHAHVRHRTSGTHQSQSGNRLIFIHTKILTYPILVRIVSFPSSNLAVSIFSRCARAVDDQINMELGV